MCRDTKSRVCGVGVSFRVCSITSEYPVSSWNSSHAPGRRMSFVLFNLNLKELATKNTRRCILPYKHALIISFFLEKDFFIVELSPGSTLFRVISLTMGLLLAAINW